MSSFCAIVPHQPGSELSDSGTDQLPDDSDMEDETLSDDEADNRASVDFNRGQDGIGPKKSRVIIRDAAYRTWQALLYYLYSDTIVFAPLASSFIPASSSSRIDSPTLDSHAVTSDRFESSTTTRPLTNASIRERRAWIRSWKAERQVSSGGGAWTGPEPCSAKAIYRLADVSNRWLAYTLMLVMIGAPVLPKL